MGIIVEDVNNGKIINKVFANWNRIKTEKQYEDFTATIQQLRFGTYKTYTIVDTIEMFGITTQNKYLANQFIFECEQILKRQA